MMLLSERLKTATATCHRDLERSMGSHRLLQSPLNKGFFLEHLQVLRKGHSAVGHEVAQHLSGDSSFGKFISKIHETEAALSSDISELNHVESTLNSDTFPFELINEFEAIGGLYVLLGSNMGRAFLGNKLAQELSQLFSNEPLYYSQTSTAAKDWKPFKLCLDGAVYTNDQTKSIISGAQLSFAFFQKIATSQTSHAIRSR